MPAPSRTLHKAQTTPSRRSTPSTDTGMPKAQTAPNRRAEAKKALEAARGKRPAMRRKDAKSQTAPHGGKVSSGPKTGSNTVNHQGIIKEEARTAPSRRSTAKDAAKGKKKEQGSKTPERPITGARGKTQMTAAEKAAYNKKNPVKKGAGGGMQKLPDSAVTDGKKKAPAKKKAKSESMGKKFNERMGKSVKAATSKQTSADGPTPSASVKPKAKKEAPKAKSKSIGDSIAKKREAKAKLKSKQKLLKPTSGAAKKPTKGAPPKATKTNRKAPTKSTKKPIRYTRGMARGFAAMKNKDK